MVKARTPAQGRLHACNAPQKVNARSEPEPGKTDCKRHHAGSHLVGDLQGLQLLLRGGRRALGACQLPVGWRSVVSTDVHR